MTRFDWKVTARLDDGTRFEEMLSSYGSAEFVARAAANTSPYNTAVITCPHGRRRIVHRDGQVEVTDTVDDAYTAEPLWTWDEQ